MLGIRLISILQAYEARFTIRLAIDNMPPDRYSSIQDLPFRLSCYAAEVALKVYFDDVKELVTAKVSLLLTPALSGEDRLAKCKAQERSAALARWSDEEFPLSYLPGVLPNLLQAVVEHTPAAFRLTSSTLGRKPVTFFADLILKQCKKPQANRKPPFIQGGNFLPVARVAFQEICSFAVQARIPPSETDKFVVDAVTTACEALKINHVPWSRNADAQNGRPSTVIVHDVWLNLGATAQPPLSLFRQDSNSSIAIQTSQAMQVSDPRAEWSVMEVQLNFFHSVLHKVKLPVEWNISHIHGTGVPPYIADAYKYVEDTYNANKPLHQLAIIASIICAGLIPDIFPSTDKQTPSNPRQFEEHLCNLDWVTQDRKGNAEAGPFITMVSGFIINMYEVTSVISRRTHGQSDLKAWFNKHSMLSYLCDSL